MAKSIMTSWFIWMLMGWVGRTFWIVKAELTCPMPQKTEKDGFLIRQDPNGQNFGEVSGVGLSPTLKAPSNEPVLYVVNDSGGDRRLGMYDPGTGKRLVTVRLPFLESETDYESMAVGSCGVSGGTCIYIADAGDNRAQKLPIGTNSSREGIPYYIYKIQEPDYRNFVDNQELDASYHHASLQFDYAHESSVTEYADCEAIFLDHTGWGEDGEIGDVYIVTKFSKEDVHNYTRVFRVPASAWPQETGALGMHSPEAVANTPGDLDRTWTRADMSLDGTVIAVGNKTHSFLFLRCPGTSVSDSLSQDSCADWSTPHPGTPAYQYESFAWYPDGSQALHITECRQCDSPLVFTTMNYDDDNNKKCPQVEWKLGELGSCQPNCTKKGEWYCQMVDDEVPTSQSICDAHGLTRPPDEIQSCDCPSASPSLAVTSESPTEDASSMETVTPTMDSLGDTTPSPMSQVEVEILASSKTTSHAPARLSLLCLTSVVTIMVSVFCLLR
uniref:Phytase-like domain-containing protein n=1 Tax=Attheya septentrionalis TaxID=420275 RepID=A0A7S2UF11_9STRA|mmetsp:Transcript_23144/g.41805  ORF Transcript_23144/g.41805 Transcript_23144/m.41805 type:complete len:499 (+) Transcript_23144:114-1610(+)